MLSVESSRLFVMYDFENSQPGDHFFEWPQHLTITPLFVHKDVERAVVINHIKDTLSSVSPFHIEVGDDALLGPNNNRPATLIVDQTGSLRELHTSLIKGLGSLGCQFESLEFCLENYLPHVRQKRTDLLTSQPHLVSSATIAEKLPKIFHMHKKILKKIDL